VAMLVLDAWQYFMHRLMHSSTYMYRRFHSWHHRVAAPYAFAAQYGHPVDSVLTETLSGAAAYLASGMSPRAAAAFFVFATVKGVDDHCGVAPPWNPLHAAFANNTAYHDVHHQRGGGRRNFSQPFFVVWDRILGTHATPVVLRRRGGGLEVKVFEEQLK
jgi:sphinganine C4-monooxygenase